MSNSILGLLFLGLVGAALAFGLRYVEEKKGERKSRGIAAQEEAGKKERRKARAAGANRDNSREAIGWEM